jgi:L-ribulose-5-phosphate 3-epimerase UlaE
LQIEKKFHQHYYYDAPSSTVHLNPFYFFGKENETKNGDRNPVEKAVNQTLRGFLESLKREVEWIEKVSYDIVLIYPIIVLNGNLISYSINSSGELNSGNLRNHIIYLTNISIKKPYPLARRVPRIKPVAIDIVTLTYLEKFLEILETKSLLVL